MYHSRWFGVLISILIIILTIPSAFHFYYGEGYEVSPLMNLKFKYWITDPTTNLSRPYFWDLDTIGGLGDQVNIRRGNAGGLPALEMQVFQDGINDNQIWASLHLKQDLNNREAEKLFFSTVGVWVYPTFSYIHDETTFHPANSFGIEINDGSHVIWFIFSDKNMGTYSLNNHTIVVVETPLNQWSYREINISSVYGEQGWSKPNSYTFILIIGLTQAIPGKRVGYFKEMIVEISPNISSELATASNMMRSYQYLSTIIPSVIVYDLRMFCDVMNDKYHI
jgi:hypothetical protein